jgi:hypothetical protein
MNPMPRLEEPMKTKALTSACALAIAIGLAAPAGAQDPQLSIGGQPVPAGQLDAVQARCDELFLVGSQAIAENATETPAANAPAAGASDDLAVTESPAEAPVDPNAKANAVAAAETPAGNMAADSEAAVGAAIDIAAITLELCQEGGFKAGTP